jgi:hypothetical protein
MEFVHHHLGHIRTLAFPEDHIGQNLRGAADNRCLGIDRGIPGDHSDVLRPEDRAEVEEFLRNQRLDRCRVIGTLTLGESGEVSRHRDRRFAGTCGGGQDDVRPGGYAQNGFVLRRIQLHVP